ncbi:hypothetical protein SAMN02910357_01023 [Succinivibrio dextrinosolvens]|jgi:hypothetical protein|uniref:hypothetical protein n=1 Tax=Succinivibrio dextrinosolvens TaxID=83771 RepID=UPI0008DEE0CB|nr:hypothetical protein [Succinivibrio dextrinosolvens]SFS48895.1 hypothetical protein SAMN02910357_01023 [Succinivibrio dextrinosolvens]
MTITNRLIAPEHMQSSDWHFEIPKKKVQIAGYDDDPFADDQFFPDDENVDVIEDYSFVFAFFRNQISWSEFKAEFNKLNMSQKLKVPFVYCGSMIQDFGYIIRDIFSIAVPILLLACLGYVAWSLMLQYFF